MRLTLNRSEMRNDLFPEVFITPAELFKIVVASTRNFVFFKQPFRTALDSGRPRSGWSSF
jgi:hypothetical protein